MLASLWKLYLSRELKFSQCKMMDPNVGWPHWRTEHVYVRMPATIFVLYAAEIVFVLFLIDFRMRFCPIGIFCIRIRQTLQTLVTHI